MRSAPGAGINVTAPMTMALAISTMMAVVF
jgi:hypothetical protein